MTGAAAALLAEIRLCRLCAADLPQEPRPVLGFAAGARVLIVGQAPGRRAHDSRTPWNDPSGDRLRRWLELPREVFYDPDRIAIVPAGFCFPGTAPGGGDHPPRPLCAATWHKRVLAVLPDLRLTLLIGRYAQLFHLGREARPTLTETVAEWRAWAPARFPLPHPSWRTTAWERRQPWFTNDLLPHLRDELRRALA